MFLQCHLRSSARSQVQRSAFTHAVSGMYIREMMENECFLENEAVPGFLSERVNCKPIGSTFSFSVFLMPPLAHITYI